MEVTYQPQAPWHWIVLLMVVLTALLLLLRGTGDAWQSLGQTKRVRALVLGFSLLAGLLFVIAAYHPVLTRKPEQEQVHLVLAVDVSDSVQRATGGWKKVRAHLVARLAKNLAAMSAERRQRGTADLLTFRGRTAFAARDIPLDRLVRELAALEETSFVAGEGSNLAGALTTAGARIDRAGGRGTLLLASDGNQTADDAIAAAQELAKRGVPVFSYALESGYPELGITAADLPRQVHAQSETYVRGVLRNNAPEPVRAQLSVDRNTKLPPSSDHFGATLTSSSHLQIVDWVRLRQPLTFQGFGLQFVDLSLSDLTGNEHRRRFFTFVNRPPQVLAVGGDFRWTAAISPTAATLVRAAPEQLPADFQVRDFDLVVLSGTPASRLTTEAMTEIVDAVKQKGLGLFFINGDHGDMSEQSHSVLMSYQKTPLAAILPVHPGPRPFLPDPPPRQIVMLVDTSGSMSGRRLEQAKEISAYIIQRFLRPKDTLDLLTFTTKVGHLVKRRKMDPAGKRFALAKLQSMKAGGGTDPRAALKLISHYRMSDCGLIFISDGKFGNISYRPDCRASVFAIGSSTVPKSSPLWKLADPFPVDKNFNPASITIPYFEPKPRNKYYERGQFKPLVIDRFLRDQETIPMPPIALQGAAVSHIKAKANLVGVRPKLTDPVLAFMDSGRGRVAAFTSGLDRDWLEKPAGRQAIERWLHELLTFTERDRYAFKLLDRGETIEMEISHVPKRGKLPAVDQLLVQLEIEAGETIGVVMRADPLVLGTYRGRIRPPRLSQSQRANLKLRELGPEALSRAQHIPMLVPPEGLVAGSLRSESYSYGTNEALLTAVAETSAGVYEPTPETPLFRRQEPATAGHSLLIWPLLAAVISLLLAFAIRRWA